MAYHSKRLTLVAMAVLVAIWLGISAVVTLHQATEAADYSAHSALTAEICEQLAAIPPGGPYPESLSDLKLAYPDGGDADLLKRFTYVTTGDRCTLQTQLGNRDITRSFP